MSGTRDGGVAGGTAACLFVVAAPLDAVLRERVARLERWWAPVGAAPVSLAEPVPGVVVGRIALARSTGSGADAAAVAALTTWGHVPPGWTADAVLAADDLALRAHDGAGVVVAWGGGRVRLVTGAAGPVALFAAEGAWSTHATAAAVLTGLPVALEASAVPELVLLGGVVGERTHVRGVRAVPAATVVEVGAGERSFWPPAVRWRSVPDGESLVDVTRRQLAGQPAPWLGLTAGLDSLVVALAAAEAGVEVPTFTWGEAGMAEPGAARVAAALGLAHTPMDLGLDDPEARGMARLAVEARWADGAARLSARGRPRWPALGTFVTGAGGETGRAFFSRWAMVDRPRPREADLLRAYLQADLGPLEDAGRRALASARESGLEGWRLLDVVYAQERVRRWGRGLVGRYPGGLVAPLTAPVVQAALAAQPDADRIAGAFHRAFVAARRPDLLSPAPAARRAGVPPVARRAAAALRARRPGAAPPGWAGLWDGRALELAWLREEVLAPGGPLAPLGEAWRQDTLRGIALGEDRALQHALRGAGLVAWRREVAADGLGA